jgi:hypothetical protein
VLFAYIYFWFSVHLNLLIFFVFFLHCLVAKNDDIELILVKLQSTITIE